ncbi:hypothetical protein [Silvanigrella aquatica]|nr:hypothetical protein [Silvanigrella aquatica]
MENHSSNTEVDFFGNTYTPSDNSKCAQNCNDLNLNKVYESLIAVNVRKNHELNKEFSLINLKIITEMRQEMKDEFNKFLNNWINLKDDKIIYPSLQRQKYQTVNDLPANANKNQKLTYVLGLPITINGIVYINPNPDSSLQYDYIISNSLGDSFKGTGDRVGLINSTAIFKNEREYSFRAFILPLRGYRKDFKYEQTLQYGISDLDVEELKAPPGSLGWINQRAHCFVEPNVTLYSKSIHAKNIPIACGLSGSTNLAITSLFAYNINLSEKEMRLFLLQAWSILSIDTGHSLQEVLSTAKLIAIYYNALLKQHDTEYKYLINYFPKNTLNNLNLITKEIRPLDENNEITDTFKWDSIETKIFKFDSDSKTSPKKRFVFATEYGKEKKYQELTAEEKSERIEFEYYFKQYDELNANNAYFGAYYDSFFKHINPSSINNIRLEAQKSFKNYFNRSCFIK